MPAQYGLFLMRSAGGNFGSSFQFGVPALGVVLERIPATLSLTGTASALIVLVAIPLEGAGRDLPELLDRLRDERARPPGPGRAQLGWDSC